MTGPNRQPAHWFNKRFRRGVILFVLLCSVLGVQSSHAPLQAVSSSQNVKVTAKVPGPAPTTPAIITSPPNNLQVYVTPLAVHGTCGPDLLVKLFNNGVVTGSTTCAADGSFTINITLTFGRNVLTALNYDTLDQAGPDSAPVNVYVVNPPVPGQVPTRRRTGAPATPGSPETTPTPEQAPTVEPSPEQSTPETIIETVTHPAKRPWLFGLILLIVFGLLLLLWWLWLLARKRRRNDDNDPPMIHPN